MSIRALVRRPTFWLGLALWVAVGVAVVLLLRARPMTASVPPALGAAPSFALVRMEGTPISDRDLRGAPYVANFVFTRCQSICPMLTSRMVQLQRRSAVHGLPVQLVSFSVDPEYDTPERLRAYATNAGADPARWTFVTGPLAAMRQVVVAGFGTVMDPVRATSSSGAGLIDIAHSARFVVVDARGQIRGHFETSDEGLAQIIATLRTLRDEERQ